MKHRLLFLPLLFAIQTLVIAQEDPSRFYPEILVVTASALNLRSAPDANSDKVTLLKQGEKLEFLEAANNGEYVQVDTLWAPWYKVRAGKNTGYVFGAHVAGEWNLLFEGEVLETQLPPLNWYGVYARDSFADVLRPVQVRLEKGYSAFREMDVMMVKTNQKDPSKLLIGSPKPLPTGKAIGNLGIYDLQQWSGGGQLYPGNVMSISVGMEPTDTVYHPSYTLYAVGRAVLNEQDFIQMSDFQVLLLDYSTQPAFRQDLTQWFTPGFPEALPNVSVQWFGDIDGDHKPDAVFNDCPYEIGCRSSLFLSSAARSGERLRKVAEYFFPGE